MQLFPAVMIGGPPHSGKTVLATALSQALRRRGVAHYVLRAYPDGEGDWSSQAEAQLVRALRYKGQVTPEYVRLVCRDIANRHLPLIVDVGGQPADWQEVVFDQCTHAILLTPDAEKRDWWRQLAARHNLPLLADLHSSQVGRSRVWRIQPILEAKLCYLERWQPVRGPVFQALVGLLRSLFDYGQEELLARHLAAAPTELTVELTRLHQTCNLGLPGDRWRPEQLAAALDYLPRGTPLAVYGRGPNWLYAALALHTWPAPFYQFDVRLGWVAAPQLVVSRGALQAVETPDYSCALKEHADYACLELRLLDQYLDFDQAAHLLLPAPPLRRGLVLSGQLPMWLFTGLALAYRQAPWLAVYQPQLNGAVVIGTRSSNGPRLGEIIPFSYSPSEESHVNRSTRGHTLKAHRRSARLTSS